MRCFTADSTREHLDGQHVMQVVLERPVLLAGLPREIRKRAGETRDLELARLHADQTMAAGLIVRAGRRSRSRGRTRPRRERRGHRSGGNRRGQRRGRVKPEEHRLAVASAPRTRAVTSASPR